MAGFVYGQLGLPTRRPQQTAVGRPTAQGVAQIYDPQRTAGAGFGGSSAGTPQQPQPGVYNPMAVQAASEPSSTPPVTPNNPYYNPNATYGLENATMPWDQPMEYWNSDVGRNDIQQNQVAGYLRMLGVYDPYSERGRFMESQAQRTIQGYEQARLTNPELWFRDYLQNSGVMGDLQRRYDMASPEALGMNYARYAPPAQTVPRGY